MATYLENLQTRRDNIAAELAALSQSKPDYSAGGRSYQWNARNESLLRQLEILDKKIASAEPFIEESWGL